MYKEYNCRVNTLRISLKWRTENEKSVKINMNDYLFLTTWIDQAMMQQAGEPSEQEPQQLNTQDVDWRFVCRGVRGAKYAWTFNSGKWFWNEEMRIYVCFSLSSWLFDEENFTSIRLIALLVICWQSKMSNRWRFWQRSKWSIALSVIDGQLSSSRTRRFSWADGLEPMYRIPSSVICSHRDKV